MVIALLLAAFFLGVPVFIGVGAAVTVRVFIAAMTFLSRE